MLSVWFWSKYSSRPLHLLGAGSLLFLAAGILSGIFAAIFILKGHDLVKNIIPLFMSILFLAVSIVLMALGLVSEMLMKTYFNTMNIQPYMVKRVSENGTVNSGEMTETIDEGKKEKEDCPGN